MAVEEKLVLGHWHTTVVFVRMKFAVFATSVTVAATV